MFSLLIGPAVVVVLYIALRLACCGTTSRPILERGFGGFARAAPPRRRGKSGLCGLQQSEGGSAPARTDSCTPLRTFWTRQVLMSVTGAGSRT